ncbi:MAG TPA: transglycosylase SLT domain-containing protein [Anaeromyxobacteraceae bacterium]|nr:transglycosylase SLT domain-containing protein [Anaeromyxobacteraceae bacterium]
MRSGWTRGALRLLFASALLLAVLAVPARLADGPRPLRPAEPELGACLAAGCPEAVREALVARYEDLLFEKMPAAPQALHEGLARAIVTEAEAARVDPVLVLAVIEVESRFDPAASSAAGALGLMQLLPATMQREVEEHRIPAAGPTDPVANVRAGVRYLRRCLDAYPGSQALALMSYNSGPNRVYELLQRGPELPDWALEYPRRVDAEWRRLRKALGAEPGTRFADARGGRVAE